MMCRAIVVGALLPLAVALKVGDQPTASADDIKKVFASPECKDTIFQNFSLVLQRIVEVSTERLQAPNYVREAVRRVGLTPSSRLTAAGNSIYGEEFRFTLRNDGPNVTTTGMWQMPQQVDCAMSKLRGRKIQNALTIGTFSGWTDLFLGAYLQRFAPDPRKFKYTTFDIASHVGGCIAKAMPLFHVSRVLFGEPALKAEGPGDFKNHRACSKKTKHDGGCTLQKYFANSTEQFDLCFLDGDHHYGQVKSEFVFLFDRCKAFMFHDVVNSRVDGVPQFWTDMKAGRFFGTGGLDKDKFHLEQCLYQPKLSDQHIFGIGILTS